MPKTGGLNLALLTQHGEEKKGLPSTVVHLLPMEVMMFVDMLPYYFLKRDKGPHTFWTSMAAVFNFKYWVEDGLDSRNTKFLDFVAECLNGLRLNEVLTDSATFPDKKFVDLDIDSLQTDSFQIHADCVKLSDLCSLLCNHIFLLKFKLVNWAGEDNFGTKAEIVRRDPPKLVRNFPASKWFVQYEKIFDGQLLTDFESPTTTSPLPQPLEATMPTTTTTNSSPSPIVTEKRKEIEVVEAEPKKQKLSDNSWDILQAAADLLHDDIENFLAPTPAITTTTTNPAEAVSVNCNTNTLSPWPFDQLGQMNSPRCTQEPIETATESQATKCKCEKEKPEFHFHFHINGCSSTNKFSIDCNEGNFKLYFE